MEEASLVVPRLRPFRPPLGPFGPKLGNGVENEFPGLPAPGSKKLKTESKKSRKS